MSLGQQNPARSCVSSNVETLFWTNEDLGIARDEYEERGFQPRPRMILPEGPIMHYAVDEEYDLPIQAHHAQWLYQTLKLTGTSNCPISDEFRNLLNRGMKHLLELPHWQPFRDAVTAAAEANKIDNIVCLGLYTVFGSDLPSQTGLYGNEQDVYDFIAEVGMLFAAREMIETCYRLKKSAAAGLSNGSTLVTPEQDEHIPMVFQDPQFRMADVRLLQALGGNVVQHDHAQRFMTESTFLFAQGLPWDVIWDITLRGPLPAIYLGGDIGLTQAGAMAEAYVEGNIDEVAEIRRISEEFLDSRDSFALGGLYLRTLSNQSLYWRRRATDEDMLAKTGALSGIEER
ncbi:hypothetical protein BDV97DRAFT_343732 [Delphinella strobiligena]|nr:hypothetical protein BDV97DRAFT_343732 [Delphinella strobiligena]